VLEVIFRQDDIVERARARKGEQAQMKTAWDSYLDQQLADPTVRQAFEEEIKVLGIGLQIADQRKRQGLT
jgi:hypothetical protein